MANRFSLDYCREEVYDIDPYYSTFANQYVSLTSVKYKNTFFNIRRLNENTHFTVIAHITLSHFFNLNITPELWKISFLKMWQTFNAVITAKLHIYICMMKSMYSRLTSTYLISFVILPTQKGSCLSESMYCLISYSISSLASCPLVLSNFFLISASIYLFGNQVSDVG